MKQNVMAPVLVTWGVGSIISRDKGQPYAAGLVRSMAATNQACTSPTRLGKGTRVGRGLRIVASAEADGLAARRALVDPRKTRIVQPVGAAASHMLQGEGQIEDWRRARLSRLSLRRTDNAERWR